MMGTIPSKMAIAYNIVIVNTVLILLLFAVKVGIKARLVTVEGPRGMTHI